MMQSSKKHGIAECDLVLTVKEKMYIYIVLKWGARDHRLPPSLRVFSPISLGESGQPQVFFYQPLFKMQTLHCSLLQLNKWFVILSETTVEKDLWNTLLLFIKAQFALGIFVGYVSICKEIVQYLVKGTYERDFSVLTFKSVSSVPWRTYHLNKDPFYGENYSLTHSCRNKRCFWGER